MGLIEGDDDLLLLSSKRFPHMYSLRFLAFHIDSFNFDRGDFDSGSTDNTSKQSIVER